MNNNPKTVLILGAGKGGTSVVAGMVHNLGISMGQTFLSADKENPTGYFEDTDFLQLHKKIFHLAKSGSSVFNPPSSEEFDKVKEKISEELKQIIHVKQKDHWGWKDPRTCLLLEYYYPFLINPHLVIVLRHPHGHAHSLRNSTAQPVRDQYVTLPNALRLINYYNGRVFDFLAKHRKIPFHLISYEDLIHHPVNTAKDLAAFLEVTLTSEKEKKVKELVLSRKRIKKKKKHFEINNYFKNLTLPKIAALIIKLITSPLKTFKVIRTRIKSWF